jgi:Asp-tRNA(Asn)/Glu-tRNA(Gln) amidotransferase A subunit family amidase
LNLWENQLTSLTLPEGLSRLTTLGLRNNPGLAYLAVPAWMDIDGLRIEGFSRDQVSFHAGSLKIRSGALEWTQGTLQFAPNPNGPWVDLPEDSPMPFSAIDDSGFYRIHGEYLKSESISIEELTIAQIHEAYENGTFNSQELVKAYLQEIFINNHNINALTTINPAAMEMAKALDEEFTMTQTLRPLHGIPIIVKDNMNTKGLPTTAGSLALKDFIPEENAFIINRLINAGAILLAKSNMSEWAFGHGNTSSTHGTTSNPYNNAFVTSGSSGGTGAAVASNFGTIGLGTDTSSSIRGPASHNALVGFRTTLGLVSRSGIVPLYLRNDVAGPMCRTVEDAVKVLEIIAGTDPEDRLTKYSEGKHKGDYQQYLDKDGLKGARIGILRVLSDSDPDPEIRQLFENAILDLKRLGAEIIDPLNIPNFHDLRQHHWCADFQKDLEEYLLTYVKQDAISTLEDVIRIGTNSRWLEQVLPWFLGRTGRFTNASGPCLDAYTDERRVAFRSAIENAMDTLSLDAIVYPTWNKKPPELEDEGDNSRVIAPHTGQPAFTVPMGFTSNNLPAGLEFLGRMYDEPKLITLSYSYEQGTQHRKPPTTK